MEIRMAEDRDLEAVARFNDRLKAGGRDEQISLRFRLPGEARYRPEGFPVYRRLMIAADGQEVRAAVLLYHHHIFINGQPQEFCWADMPVSEGIVDRKYSLAIIQLMKSAAAYQPFQMTMGVGTPDVEAFKFLVKLKWRYRLVPFFFYPVRATRVLRGMPYLQQHEKLRYGALLGAYSGAGAGLSGWLSLRRSMASAFSSYACKEAESFGEWADRIFEDALPSYGAAVRSDATSLNIVYPPDRAGLTRLRIRRKGAAEEPRNEGWVVVAAKQMNANSYFGDLKVGTLVDGFGRPEHVPALIGAGIDHLVGQNVDLIIGNFLHGAWADACRAAGMLPGPSNYHVFVSPAGPLLLEESCVPERIHVARGHGDGMDHLL